MNEIVILGKSAIPTKVIGSIPERENDSEEKERFVTLSVQDDVLNIWIHKPIKENREDSEKINSGDRINVSLEDVDGLFIMGVVGSQEKPIQARVDGRMKKTKRLEIVSSGDVLYLHIHPVGDDGQDVLERGWAIKLDLSLFKDAINRLLVSIDAAPNVEKDAINFSSEITSPEKSFNTSESVFPDEVEEFVEGATKQVIVNAYERDPKARAACVRHYDYSCVICNFNFLEKFGEIGRNFIHVHHLQPISKAKEQHCVDPIQDLRPVCPNCHAMLHRRNPPFSIEELLAIRVGRCQP